MWLALDGEGPLYQQVYRGLRAAILAGDLRAGSRLPATRTLGRELSLSRNTVLQAYEQLVDEGYVVARTGSGTYVATTLPEERVSVGAAKRSAPAPRARSKPGNRPSISSHSA